MRVRLVFTQAIAELLFDIEFANVFNSSDLLVRLEPLDGLAVAFVVKPPRDLFPFVLMPGAATLVGLVVLFTLNLGNVQGL